MPAARAQTLGTESSGAGPARALDRWSGAVFAVLAAVAWAVLVWMGRGLSFYSDEWYFIANRSLFDPSTWFPPHGEHWATVPIVAYRLIMELVGLRTYVPYLALLVALHVLVAAGVFVLLRRWVGPAPALAAGCLVLFFGSGFENLFWAFQIGFVAATAAGVLMIWLLEGPPTARRLVAIVVLLMLSLASTGLGLVFLAIVGMSMVLRCEWRRYVPLLIVPAATYGAWYIAIGHTGTGSQRNPFVLDQALLTPGFVAEGIENSIGALTGLPPLFAGAAAIAFVALLAVRAARRQPIPTATIALGFGVVLQYTLIGLTRAGIFPGQSDYTRYTYLGGILTLLAVGAFVGRLRSSLSPGSWRLLGLAGAVILVPAAILNVQLLVAGRDLFAVRAEFTRALIADALAPQLPPDVDPDKSLFFVPSPNELRRIEARYGMPLTDTLAGDAVRPTSPRIKTLADERFHGAEVGP
ncbi:MAG: hypothetical protein E6I94_02500 [Chloroflexi bacterium]|nr:MAG: hypothetical protein E6I94_02500 [Chloroflexota bacterium]